jgi:hypothetical protein
VFAPGSNSSRKAPGLFERAYQAGAGAGAVHFPGLSLSHELSYSAPQQPAPSALARPAGVGLTDQSASMITSTHACNTDAVRSSSSMASSDSSFAVDGVGRVECSAVQLRAVWESGVQVEVGAGALARWAKKRVPAASGKSQFLSMIAQESGDQAVRCGHLFLFDLRSHRGADG